MTVCLYLLPPLYPTLISDCLVTVIGQQRGFTPSDWYTKSLKNLQPATLVGKTIKIDGGSVIAFAGFEDRILKLLGDFKQFYPAFKIANADRPMKGASEFVNEFNASESPNNEVSALGFSVVHYQGDDSYNANSISRIHNRIETSRFGQCAAAGSGTNDILEAVRYFDSEYYIENEEHVPHLRILCMIGRLNCEKFFVKDKNQTWGGCLQSTIYGIQERRFFSAPDWVYCGFTINIDGKEARLTRMKKIVLIWSRDSHTFVRWQVYSRSKRMNHVWKIGSGLEEVEEGMTDNDYQPFSPQLATVIWRVSYKGRSWDRITTLNGHLMKHLKTSIPDDGNIGWEIDQEYINFIADEEITYYRQRFSGREVT